jgi:hypothetical protein
MSNSCDFSNLDWSLSSIFGFNLDEALRKLQEASSSKDHWLRLGMFNEEIPRRTPSPPGKPDG